MSPPKISLLHLIWLVLLAAAVSGCAAAQDTSKAYSRSAISRGAIVPADTIRLHEYLNYYEQRFPEPIDQPLGLDLRLGNSQIPAAGGLVWLQIGLQAQSGELAVRTPLNLALVLDTSGSMDSPDKMPFLQQSLGVFLGSLQPEDQVALVTYSDEADLLWPSSPVGDGRWIRGAIESLRPGGSTNLHAGLMLGLAEVDRQFDIRRNNRVILLTDGIANQGVTDSSEIAREALAFNQRGIYLSTIGLGLDFNDELLATLAQQGRGAYHFVDSAQEMDKIFRQEVEGLVESAANDVRVALRTMPGVRLISITGYEGTPPQSGAEVNLQDMGSGNSQVLMARLQVDPGLPGSRPLAEVTLRYEDAFAQRARETSATLVAQAAELFGYDPLTDVEVQRNVTIVQSAEALIAIDGLFNQGRYAEAWQLAYEMEQELRWLAALAADQQLVQDADLFARYQLTLVSALGYTPSLYEPTSVPPIGGQDQRWGSTAVPAYPPLPTLEVDR
ncbi:MAG TPA: VWA domain-containing protein [Anaerolineales bacterium]|nr:VWA domain-containing protein [Anaerolineales bacterium]